MQEEKEEQPPKSIFGAAPNLPAFDRHEKEPTHPAQTMHREQFKETSGFLVVTNKLNKRSLRAFRKFVRDLSDEEAKEAIRFMENASPKEDKGPEPHSTDDDLLKQIRESAENIRKLQTDIDELKAQHPELAGPQLKPLPEHGDEGEDQPDPEEKDTKVE